MKKYIIMLLMVFGVSLLSFGHNDRNNRRDDNSHNHNDRYDSRYDRRYDDRNDRGRSNDYRSREDNRDSRNRQNYNGDVYCVRWENNGRTCSKFEAIGRNGERYEVPEVPPKF